MEYMIYDVQDMAVDFCYIAHTDSVFYSATSTGMNRWKHVSMGLLPDTQNCRLRMRRECRERFSRHRLLRKPLVSDHGMHHGTYVTHVPWCMSGSNPRWRGKRSRHSRRMCNLHFNVSGKRAMVTVLTSICASANCAIIGIGNVLLMMYRWQ